MGTHGRGRFAASFRRRLGRTCSRARPAVSTGREAFSVPEASPVGPPSRGGPRTDATRLHGSYLNCLRRRMHPIAAVLPREPLVRFIITGNLASLFIPFQAPAKLHRQ